jgi:hypothetical protein
MAMMKRVWEEIQSDEELALLSEYAMSVGGEESKLVMDAIIEIANARLKLAERS